MNLERVGKNQDSSPEPQALSPCSMRSESSSLAVVDVAPLISGAGDVERVAQMLRSACRENGFFYVVGHGVSSELQGRLEEIPRQLTPVFICRSGSRSLGACALAVRAGIESPAHLEGGLSRQLRAISYQLSVSAGLPHLYSGCLWPHAGAPPVGLRHSRWSPDG